MRSNIETTNPYNNRRKATATLYNFHNELNDTVIDASWKVCDPLLVYSVKNYTSREWPMEFWPTFNAPGAQLFNKVLKEYNLNNIK
jgi:hypothetical protein